MEDELQGTKRRLVDSALAFGGVIIEGVVVGSSADGESAEAAV